MRANEKGIVVQDLRARRLIVGVIQSNQRVSQKGSELATGCLQLRGRARRLDYFCQVGFDLQFRVAGAVYRGRPVDFLCAGEDRTRQLEFPKLACESEQPWARGLPVRHLVQAIAEREKRVE